MSETVHKAAVNGLVRQWPFMAPPALLQKSVAQNCGEREAQRAAAGLREAHPVGNHGDNTLELAK